MVGCQRDVYRFTEGGVYGTTYHVSYRSDTDYDAEIRQEMEASESIVVDVQQEFRDFQVEPGRERSGGFAFYRDVHEGERGESSDRGAFDITVAPLVNVWGFGFKNEKLPSGRESRFFIAIRGNG